jgi:hypothetical protein
MIRERTHRARFTKEAASRERLLLTTTVGLLGVEKPRGFFNANPGSRGPIRVDKPSGFFNTPLFRRRT